MAGFLTTHVLDQAIGRPASNMEIDLRRVEDGRCIWLQSFRTNEDGRVETPLLCNESFEAGIYELIFHVADYFRRPDRVPRVDQTLFTEIPIRIRIDSPDEHYHIPLLLTPWSYSTYRGS